MCVFNGGSFCRARDGALVSFPDRRTLAGVGNFMDVLPYVASKTKGHGCGESEKGRT